MTSSNDEEDFYVIASYDIPSTSTSQLPFLGSTTKALSTGQKSGKQVAVITQQGNGIHLFNLVDQTPINSFTLGPLIKYQTPAYCRTISSLKGKEKESAIETESTHAKLRETWISIKPKDKTSSSELRKWFGKERRDGRTDDDLEFLSREYQDKILDLNPSIDLQEFTFIVHESGKVRVIDNDLEDVVTLDGLSSCEACRIQSASQCSFFPNLPPSSALMFTLNFSRSNSSDITSKKNRKSNGPVTEARAFKIRLNFILFTPPVNDASPTLQLFSTLELGEELIDVSLDVATGFISTLDKNGVWQTFQLSALPFENLVHLDNFLPKVSLKPMKTLHLTHLKLYTLDSHISFSRYLLSVGLSFVLLVAPSTVLGQVKVLLWDLKYGVIITESFLPCPLATDLNVSLAQVGPNSISITLTPIPSSKQTTQSTYYIVSIPIPSQSTLATVLNHYSLTEPYLKSKSQQTQNERIHNPLSSSAKVSLIQSGDESRKILLLKLRTFSKQKEWEKMWTSFKGWEKLESARLKEYEEIRLDMRRRAVTKNKPSLSGANLIPVGANRMVLESVSRMGSESLAQDEEMKMDEGALEEVEENDYDELTNVKIIGGKTGKRLEPAYPTDFVAELLKIILPVNTTADNAKENAYKVVPYASPLLQHLISKTLVSDSSVSEGLLNALFRLNDWETLSKAMEQISDLSETDLMKILKFVLNQWQLQQSAQAVAPLSSLPSFPHFLNAIVQYSYSSVPMRKALKQIFNLDEILVILKCLSTWIEYHSGINNVSIYSGSKTPPPLEALIRFTSLILDANLITLLQDPITHDVIIHLTQHIRKLKEMLGYFKDVNSSLNALTLDSKEKRRLRRTEMGKSNRLKAHEAGMNIGEYTIEWFDL